MKIRIAQTPLQFLTFSWLAFAVIVCAAVMLSGPPPSHELSRALKFGFDAYGRSLWQIIPRAALWSSIFALAAALTATVLGLILGSALALAPKRAQELGARTVEGLLAFPYLLFALAIAVVRGPRMSTLIGALLVGTVPTLIRMVHVRNREILHEEYVTVAFAMGAGKLHILARHLIPATFSLCLVKLPNLFASALMAEASLSFLGIGAPSGEDTWGALLAQSRDYLLEAPHIALSSGFPLFLTILSLQILSERFEKNKLS